jgi:hypothetical protein
MVRHGWAVHVLSARLRSSAGKTGIETLDLCRDRAQENRNLQKISAMDGSFWRFEARMVTVIVPYCARDLCRMDLCPNKEFASTSDLS